MASRSPRRIDLMRAAGFKFEIEPADVDETLPGSLSPVQAVEFLSKKKALAVAKHHRDAVVIGSDTLVELDGTVLGKPEDEHDAVRMLMLLSGKTHNVHTGVYIAGGGFDFGFAETTHVTFYPFSRREAEEYVHTGEPFDKAGAYAVQGKGMFLVQKMQGDYNTVVGLPVARLTRILKALPL